MCLLCQQLGLSLDGVFIVSIRTEPNSVPVLLINYAHTICVLQESIYW